MTPHALIKKYNKFGLNCDDIMGIMFPGNLSENADFVNLMTGIMINALSDCRCKDVRKIMTPVELLTFSTDYNIINISKCLYCSCRSFMSKIISKRIVDIELFIKFMEEIILLQKKNEYCSCRDKKNSICRICDLDNSLSNFKKVNG